MITIGLADDQPLVRTGFSLLINSQADMEASWQVADGTQVAHQKPVDIVLMDIQMPELNGIEATKQLIAVNPDTKVIMLTTFDDEEFVAGAIAAGASGFLLKDVEPEELFDAIRLVYDGQAVLAPTATAHVLELLKHPNQPAAPTPSPAVAELTPRETVILRLIALGLTNQEIADHEYVSMATVKTNVRHILMKTNSRDRVHAVLFAYRTGVVSTDELLSGGQV